MRVAGVAIEAGITYLVAADPATAPGVLCTPVAGGLRRIEPNASLDEAHRLVDWTQRIEQSLRSLQVSRVALTQTRKFSSLNYTEASARIVGVCALMAACVECKLAFSVIKTGTIGELIDLDPKLLKEADPAQFGFSEAPPYWKAGMVKAFGAAAVLLSEDGQ